MDNNLYWKTGTFKNELSMIQDEDLNDFIRLCIVSLPDYFFEIPASSTGKYHPEYSLGKGGLVRHTKASIRIANDLLNLEQYQEVAQHREEIIAALILHDGVKKGFNQGTATTSRHPLYAEQLIKECLMEYDKFIGKEKYAKLEPKVLYICRLILSHMGQWNWDTTFIKEILPKPETPEQQFVHLCDYLASRKYLTCEVN